MSLLALLTACTGQNGSKSSGFASFVPVDSESTNRQIFHFTGASQAFHVPRNVDKLTIIAKGAGTPSARGGLVKATVAVRPGELLSVYVGGAPQGYRGGYNGGGDGGFCAYNGPCDMIGKGGAGGSDVRTGRAALGDRIIAAGGAGGRGGHAEYHGGLGGVGGGLSGRAGQDGVSVNSPSGPGRAGGGSGGRGGAQFVGGRGGDGGKGSDQNIAPGVHGVQGTLGVGGLGGNGGGLGDIAGGAGGGGGGGYHGGGGGGSGANGGNYENNGDEEGVASGGGGGGGSSFAEAGAQNVRIEAGKGNSGNGLIIISW